MDRIAQRYADPFAFLGAYFQAGRLHECICEIVKAINRDIKREAEDRQEQMLWELWVHKYQGNQSFGAWKENMLAKPAAEKPKPKVVEVQDMQSNLDIAAQTLEKLQRSTGKGGG